MDKHIRSDVILITTDEDLALKCDLITKIYTSDKTVYTTWVIFNKISYFDAMFNSGMKESRDKELQIDLPSDIVIRYLRLLSGESILDKIEVSREYIIDIYDLISYHQVPQSIIDVFTLTAFYSIELYQWNKLHKIISINVMCDLMIKTYNDKDLSIAEASVIKWPSYRKNKDLWYVLWNEYLVKYIYDPLLIWIFIRQLPLKGLNIYLDKMDSMKIQLDKYGLTMKVNTIKGLEFMIPMFSEDKYFHVYVDSVTKMIDRSR